MLSTWEVSCRLATKLGYDENKHLAASKYFSIDRRSAAAADTFVSAAPLVHAVPTAKQVAARPDGYEVVIISNTESNDRSAIARISSSVRS